MTFPDGGAYKDSDLLDGDASMFNIGFWELFLIVVIGLLFVGPKQLPEVAKTVTRAIRKLRRTGDDLRDSARQVVEEVIPPEDLYGYGDEGRKIAAPATSYLPKPEPEPPPEKKPEDGEGSKAGDSDLAV